MGLKMHLVACHKLIQDFKPDAVILDPIGTLTFAGTVSDTTSMLTRLMDFLKSQQITAVWTSLTLGEEKERTDVAISSLVDTWLLLRDIELGGERNRAIYVLKSRGMAHSNQIREFLLTDHGIELAEIYLGPEGVLTGAARKSQEARETAQALARKLEIEAKRRKLARKRQVLEATYCRPAQQFRCGRGGNESGHWRGSRSRGSPSSG
jgi:circadian clock protein KaiC